MATTALSVDEICRTAKAASRVLATLDALTKNRALHAVADALLERSG
jgi:gamma-glutamyl phosphate reductase